MAAKAGTGTARGKAAAGGRKATATKSTARTAPAKGARKRPTDARTTTTSEPRRKSPKTAASPRKPPGGAGQPADAEPLSLAKLGQIALTARNLNKSIAFYGDVLGLRMIARFDPAGFAFFRLGGGVRLMLSATASAASLYFNVDDLDASVAHLRRRGVKFLQKPAMVHRDEDGDFGKKGVEEWMAFFHDPSGNLLALVERR